MVSLIEVGLKKSPLSLSLTIIPVSTHCSIAVQLSGGLMGSNFMARLPSCALSSQIHTISFSRRNQTFFGPISLPTSSANSLCGRPGFGSSTRGRPLRDIWPSSQTRMCLQCRSTVPVFLLSRNSSRCSRPRSAQCACRHLNTGQLFPSLGIRTAVLKSDDVHCSVPSECSQTHGHLIECFPRSASMICPYNPASLTAPTRSSVEMSPL